MSRVLAGEAVADIGAVGVTPGTRERVVGELLTTMRSWEEVAPRRRATAGDLLARLGDPRFSEEYWYLPAAPLLGFVEVPAGKFSMGSDKTKDPDSADYERPQHELELPGFFIGRFPVTVAQFRAFVEASGQQPEDPDSLQGRANHPVVWVSWHEARAYCEWLGERLLELAPERAKKSRNEAETLILAQCGGGWPERGFAERGGVGEGGAGRRWPNLSLGRQG